MTKPVPFDEAVFQNINAFNELLVGTEYANFKEEWFFKRKDACWMVVNQTTRNANVFIKCREALIKPHGRSTDHREIIYVSKNEG